MTVMPEAIGREVADVGLKRDEPRAHEHGVGRKGLPHVLGALVERRGDAFEEARLGEVLPGHGAENAAHGRFVLQRDDEGDELGFKLGELEGLGKLLDVVGKGLAQARNLVGDALFEIFKRFVEADRRAQAKPVLYEAVGGKKLPVVAELVGRRAPVVEIKKRGFARNRFARDLLQAAEALFNGDEVVVFLVFIGAAFRARFVAVDARGDLCAGIVVGVLEEVAGNVGQIARGQVAAAGVHDEREVQFIAELAEPRQLRQGIGVVHVGDVDYLPEVAQAKKPRRPELERGRRVAESGRAVHAV